VPLEYLLTRSSLRSITLSSASGKEGEVRFETHRYGKSRSNISTPLNEIQLPALKINVTLTYQVIVFNKKH